MSTNFLQLQDRIREQRALVAILGLGYVGLPLAEAFLNAGLAVLGFEVDPDKVARLGQGETYIERFPAARVQAMRQRGFEATDRFDRLREPDAILICVPTPLTEAREPDLQFIRDSARALAKCLRPGQLVVLESTTYPGTTREVVLPLLQATGLRAGEDFFLAFSPERVDPGNPSFSTSTIPKVIGGWDSQSRTLAELLYAHAIVQVVPVSSLEVAEACKLLENTYRAVNIALVNELKVIYDAMGIDVWEVIEAAKTKPFGFQPFYPGPGLGGHCIPVDPFYLSWVARKHDLAARFIELAGEVNTSMPGYIVSKVATALAARDKRLAGSKITLLGMAYKKDVDDTRESPGLALCELLHQAGAQVEYNDPHVPMLPSTGRHLHLQLISQPLTAEYLRSQECVLIVTDHSAYDWHFILQHSTLVVDTRNATRGVSEFQDRVVRA